MKKRNKSKKTVRVVLPICQMKEPDRLACYLQTQFKAVLECSRQPRAGTGKMDGRLGMMQQLACLHLVGI